MHKGFRPKGDKTCSSCDNEINGASETLCKSCLERAAELIATTPFRMDVVVVAHPDSSWGVGNMRGHHS